MKFITDYPVRSDLGGEWIKPETIISVIQHLELMGIHGLGITDHPAPSQKWLENGGHEAFDPFAMLSFAAAITKKTELFSHLIVLPYRNPLLTLSGMTSVDVLSGGRTTFVFGAGYLRSEYSALGVDFEDRNALFDDAIAVIKMAGGNRAVTHKGPTYDALDQIVKPGFVQLPHPPLWLGGKSNLTMRRIAAWGQGWSVMMGSPTLSKTARTKNIESVADLKEALANLQVLVEANGRSMDEITIQASTPALHPSTNASVEQKINALGELASIGVSWVGADLWSDSISESKDRYQDFSENIAPHAQ